MMTYEEAVKYIEDSSQYGSVLGLDNMVELLNRIGNPQDGLRIIHLAGTNGKGSTSAFISSILAMAGYKVGRYVSPAVFSSREIIQIQESDKIEYITENGFANSIGIIEPHCKAMLEEGLNHPTAFEIETTMTFLYLNREKVDFLVLETGLGGRLDATNVIKSPLISVLTPISLDHKDFLGDSLREVATEKLGIIKENCTVVTCDQDSMVMEMIIEEAQKKNSPLIIGEYKNIKDKEFIIEGTKFSIEEEKKINKYRISLLGAHQIKNGYLAIKAIRALINMGYDISQSAIEEGLSKADWEGRFEIISMDPTIIIDGAHNLDAASALKESLELYFKDRDKIFIMGVFKDKDYRGILRLIGPLAKKIITITPSNPRAMDGDILANEAKSISKARVESANTIDQALSLAMKDINNHIIVSFGSLSFLSEVKKYIRT